MTTLAATYASLSDALWTRQQLLQLDIAPADISILGRGRASSTGDEILCLGWLSRAIAGVPSSEMSAAAGCALVRAGISQPIAKHQARALEHGGALVSVTVASPSLREAAELVLARYADMPDLVGTVSERMTAAAKLQELRDRVRRPPPLTAAEERA